RSRSRCYQSTGPLLVRGPVAVSSRASPDGHSKTTGLAWGLSPAGANPGSEKCSSPNCSIWCN
ncbi:MAG: hypothetical protein VB853_09045, partial [Pirellulales bacterium]